MQQSASKRILIIDDNPAIHEDFRKILSNHRRKSNLKRTAAMLFDQVAPAPIVNHGEFEIDSAFQGQEGLAKVEQSISEGRPYALAFVDIRMPPGWDGIETLAKIWERDPNLQAVICSAYSDYSWDNITARLGDSDQLLILKKPFDNIEVAQLAHALTKKWRISQELNVKLVENQQLLSTFFENTSEAIVVSDVEKKIVAVNQAFTRLTGYTLPDVGTDGISHGVALIAQSMSETAWTHAVTSGHWQGELWLPRKDSGDFPAWVHVNAIKNTAGDVTSYVTLFSDITRLIDQQRQLEYLANYDTLTGLPNRALFYDRLRHAIERAERNQSRCAIAFIDLDNFKYVNDTLGHASGDELLRRMADQLKAILRTDDTVCSFGTEAAASKAGECVPCRIGGDEFALLMEDIPDTECVARIAHRITTAFKDGIRVDGHELFVTTSIGIAIFPDDGQDVETLLRNSDTAMYKAKEAGKSGYRFFAANMNVEAGKRLLLEGKLRKALENGEFFLVYQPQIDIKTADVFGVEALIRWRDPEAGIISPADFMPIAENNGLINTIGQWVLETACRQAQAWISRGFPMKVSVNLSARQFQQKRLAGMIADTIAKSGLSPQSLELELTESAIMQEPDVTARILAELKESGVSIAIDDFGTGYSSLAYLKRFPVDLLKIDRAFVRDITSDADDAAIVTAVINLAHNLGIKVMAEGVETAEQFQFLRKKHCDAAQGYWFSKPLEPDELQSFVLSRSVIKLA